MDYYLDIEMKPNKKMQESHLINLVYYKFHKALVELKTDTIGVSFPGYRVKLGKFLRVHGNNTNLNDLLCLNWLGDLAVYCEIGEVKKIPSNVKFRSISRIRTNMSKSKLRRLKKRGSITPNQEKAYKAKMFSLGLDNPYLDIQSGSTGQKHRRFITFGELHEQPVFGKFDSYGLSAVSTIPWF